MAALTVLRRDYWMGKARAKKNSPWLKVVAVFAALWVWGHVNGSGTSHAHSATPRPGASASARPHR